jgi:DNA-binding response OmpR family regulator
MVLLDLGMPGMNGKEVLRQMREEGLDVPVLVSSGYSEHEVYEQLDAFEIAGFLPKPFRVSHLVNKVRSILEVHSRA